MKLAMAATEPLSSISLPNSAPSRNSGKNCARKRAALPMKVCVQWASSGSPANAAAINAAAGASSRTLQPRKASQISSAEAEQDAEQAHRSDCLRAGRRDRASSAGRGLAVLAPGSRAPTRRPSSRSMVRKSHSALSFDEEPSSASIVAADEVDAHAAPKARPRRRRDRRPAAAARSCAAP